MPPLVMDLAAATEVPVRLLLRRAVMVIAIIDLLVADETNVLIDAIPTLKMKGMIVPQVAAHTDVMVRMMVGIAAPPAIIIADTLDRKKKDATILPAAVSTVRNRLV